MKSLGTYIKTTVACGVTLAIVSLASALQAQEQQGKAVVRAVRGSAQFKDAGKDWAALKVGTVLKSGAVIKTAADGQVDLFLGQNGPVVRVTQATEMGVDKLSINKTDAETVIETQLDLKAGTILGNVKKLAQASRYEVKTPKGTCAIRGTEYRISDTGNVVVKSGNVVVNYNGRSYDVGPGQQFNPSTQAVENAPTEVAGTVWIVVEPGGETGGTGGAGPVIIDLPTTPISPGATDVAPTEPTHPHPVSTK